MRVALVTAKGIVENVIVVESIEFAEKLYGDRYTYVEADDAPADPGGTYDAGAGEWALAPHEE